MRPSGARLGLALLAAPLLAGCGTVLGNVGGLSFMSDHRMEPYGGVKLCLEVGTHCFKEAGDPREQNRLGASLCGAYWLALDLPMSAVADTLTLPLTVPATLRGEARTGPVHWGDPDVLILRWPEEKRGPDGDSPPE
jgi:uncharacterized protein YceK